MSYCKHGFPKLSHARAHVSIIHCFLQVLYTTYCVRTELFVGRPTLARPCEEVHWRTSLMSSSLHLQQCPACFDCLIWTVLEMAGRWPYTRCFVGCCFQVLFNMTRSILVHFSSSVFSIRFVSVPVVHPYCRIDTTAAWKILRFILSDRCDFNIIVDLSITVNASTSHI